MKNFIEKHERILLIIVLMLASFLRLYDLENLPSGFHNDEASFFLNAQILKETLRDEDNRFLPMYLISYIDPKPALYSYLQIPFIMILGETHVAARMPAVIFGVISIGIMFLLVKKLLNPQLALLASFILAMSPWHIMLSRASQEVMLSFTFTLAAILLLIISLRRKQKKLVPLIFFILFSLLSMYSYHPAKIYLPLLSVLVLIYFLLTKRIAIKYFLFLLISVITATAITVLAGGFTRYDAVSIFSTQGVQLVIDEQIRTASGHAHSFFIRVFSNKLTGYTLAIIKQYGDYFSLSYLFTNGGPPSRYMVPFHGQLYLFEGLLLLLGVVYGLSKENFRKVVYFFLAWLLIVPLPSALTVQEVPSTIRPFPMLIPIVVFIALGIYALCTFPLKKVYRFVPVVFLALLYIGGFSYFWFQFSVQQPYYHPWYRHYGSEQLPKAVMAIAHKYDQIHIASNQYVYFSLSKAITISDLQDSHPERLKDPATFGKITFVNDGCRIFPTEKKVLLVVRGECKDFSLWGFNKISQINFKDNNPEYVFYEYRPRKKAL